MHLLGSDRAKSAYDAFAYTNFPYAQTHIAHLYLLGRLFGLETPDFRRARVLELGCGGGGNILPMADQYPESQFVGVDLSLRQIEQGRALAQEVGVANLKLLAESIGDFGSRSQTFDYIICHGTFSWVAPDIQSKIMSILGGCLSPGGVAFVSYNTLPGWSGPSALRDMMLVHARRQTDPIARVAEARRLLELVVAAQGDVEGYYRLLVEGELETIRTQSEQYVFHEYLEDVNQPIYFADFTAMAATHGLAYVCDADPGLGHVENYAAAVRPFLYAITDRLRREQYFDFMHNRRFRSSLLARDCVRPTPPEARRIEPFWLAWQARPDPPEVTGAQHLTLPLTFVCANGLRLSFRERAGAALAIVLHDMRGAPRRVSEIAQEAKIRFRLADSETDLVRRLCEFVLPTYLSRGIDIRADRGRHVSNVSKRPIGLPVARIEALRTDRVTNALHQVVVLDGATRALLPHLDGRTERAKLPAILAAAQNSGQPVSPLVLADATASVGRALQQLAQSALLVG